MKKSTVLFPLAMTALLASCSFKPITSSRSESHHESNTSIPSVPSEPSTPSEPSVPSLPTSDPSSEPTSTPTSTPTSEPTSTPTSTPTSNPSSSSSSSSKSSSSSSSEPSSSIPSSSSSEEPRVPEITSHETKEVSCLKVEFTSSGTPKYTETGNSLTIHYFNDSSVPYVSIYDYVEGVLCFASWYSGVRSYEADLTDYTFEITNNHDKEDGRCFVDFEHQTITFKDKDAYFDFITDTKCPLGGAIQGGEQFFVGSTFDYEAPTEDYVISLAEYGLVGYLDEFDGYLPFEIFDALLNPYNIIGDWVYNGEYFYDYAQGTTGNSTYYQVYKHIREEATCFDEDYMNYIYGMIGLRLDTGFGNDERPSRANPGTTIKYFKNGAMAALAPYKSKITSTNLNVSNNALIEFAKECMDDGGHSSYLYQANLFCDQDPTYTWDSYGREYINTTQNLNYASYYRNNLGKDPASFTGNTSANAAYTEYNGVAFVIFDGFNAPSEAISDSKITSSNYYNDTISLTHWANEQIREHGIKDVVIDLSNNGGGSVFTEEFIASWICGNATTGNTSVYRNPKTGAYVKCNIKADVNLNGRYDSGDYLPSDVNVYCMIDGGSFSCGNKLPTDISENRTTYFIGSRSGGGSCAVEERNIGIGSKLRMGVDYQIGMPTSTSDNFVSNEKGVTANFYNVGNDLSSLQKLYDWETVTAKIKANR